MRILFLPAYFYPEHAASSYLGNDLRMALCGNGADIVLYAPTPSRNVSSEVRAEYSNKHRREILYDGRMIVRRFPLYAEGKNPVFRALRYSLCWLIQFHKALWTKDIDCIYLASTPPIQGLIGSWAGRLRGIPFVYNLQDIFPDSLVGTSLAKKDGLLWRVGRWVENITYKGADKIIVISEDFKRNIMAKGVPEEKIAVVYNWVDENAVQPVVDEDNELFEEFGISREKFRVVYAGNLGNAQNIEIIVEAAKRLKANPDIEFVLFGKGGLEDEIKATKEKEQLNNLKILPLQPYERVSKVYGLGNVCIVACKPGLGGAAMPSKTWSIMSSGRAVLANFDEGELKDILEKNNCGVFTQAGDLDGFVTAIENLAQNPARCQEMGKNGREFILKNLTKEVGTQKYVNVIKSVVGQ